MPTPNDFSDYRFMARQDDYKQTSREQDDRDVFTKDNEPLLPGPASGNYPRTFDTGYGPAETPATGVYPDAYSRVDVPGTNPKSGEYGQSLGTQDGAVAVGSYPNIWGYGDRPDRQEASAREGEPRKLAKATGSSQSNFANLQHYLNNSLDTPGCRVCNDASKPWSPPHGAEGE